MFPYSSPVVKAVEAHKKSGDDACTSKACYWLPTSKKVCEILQLFNIFTISFAMFRFIQQMCVI